MMSAGTPEQGTTWLWPLVVFVAALVLLLSGMDPNSFNIYDEGVVAFGAERLLRGDVPYRDFWAMGYVPGQFWAVAALFELFGESLLVERIWDVVVRAGITLLVFLVVQRLGSRVTAAAAALLVVAWLWAVGFHGYPLFPATLVTLCSVRAFIEFVLRPQRHSWLWLAGAFAGVTALFRHDIGFYVLATEVLTAFLVYRVSLAKSDADVAEAHSGAIAPFMRWLWPLVGGAILAGLPAALVLLWQVPFADLWEQLFVLPATIYPLVRSLPYPSLLLPFADLIQGGVQAMPTAVLGFLNVAPYYFHVVVLIGALHHVVSSWRRDGWSALSGRTLCIAFLMILLCALFLKTLVRPGYVQLAQVIVMAIVLGALLLPPRGRVAVVVSGLCIVLMTTFPLGKLLQGQRAREAATVQKAAPFGVPADQAAAIKFIQANVPPGASIYVGNGRHDITVVNDVMFYFLADRPSATKHHELHPGVTTTLEVQSKMIDEIAAANVEFVVLFVSGSTRREPNLSSKSSGVLVLDEYLSAHYEHVHTLGRYVIKRRRPD